MATVSKVFKEDTTVRAKLPSGAAVAALLAALVGLLTFAVVNIYSEMSAGFSKAITLNAGIGPYSGKELFWLSAWFVSWVVLHVALRKKDLNLRKWFGAWLVGMAVATLLMYPPVFEFIADALKGG